MSKSKHPIMELPARVPRLTIVVIVSLLVYSTIVFIVLFLVYQLIGPESRTQIWGINFKQASQEFRPGQAVTINLDTVTVYVPPFAIPLPGTIFIIMRERDLYPIASQPEWSHLQVVDVQFRNAEGTPIPGITLSVPIKICFKLTQTEWQDFVDRPRSYSIQYYALKKNVPIWLSLPVINHPDLLQVCGRTDHLSLFALAIKSEISSSVTGPTTTPNPTATPTRSSLTYLKGSTNEPGPGIAGQPTSFLALTKTPQPTATNTSWRAITPTKTPRFTSTPTRTPRPTVTPRPTGTRPPPTATPRSPATRPPPTPTRPPTATRPPPTATRRTPPPH